MRRLYAILILLLPLVAAGPAVAANGPPLQAPAGETADGTALVAAQDDARVSMLLPLWRADNDQSWRLLASSAQTLSQPTDYSLGFRGLGFAAQSGGGLAYAMNPNWMAHARVRQQSWLGASSVGSCLAANPAVRRVSCVDNRLTPGLLQSEIGATFRGSGYSVGMDVSTSRPEQASPLLPRVLPEASLMSTTVDGVPFTALQDSTSLHARGRVSLGDRSGIDIGASVGRVRLLPGNVLGVGSLGQKSLSLGVDSGTLSGRIVGRVVQPEPGTGVNTDLLGADHRWTSIDLGVTWRLPWQGSLSFGAQNLWSSGHAPKPKDGPEPTQSRIPYVQYHQDF